MTVRADIEHLLGGRRHANNFTRVIAFNPDNSLKQGLPTAILLSRPEILTKNQEGDEEKEDVSHFSLLFQSRT